MENISWILIENIRWLMIENIRESLAGQSGRVHRRLPNKLKFKLSSDEAKQAAPAALMFVFKLKLGRIYFGNSIQLSKHID